MNLWVLVLLLPVFIPAVVIHEVAHGYVAYRLGDTTAKDRGRLTLNPIAHVSLVGSILVPLLLVVFNAGFIFAWAKPVPVNPRRFRHPLKDMGWVAIAGPISNFIQALLFAGIFRVLTFSFGMGEDQVFLSLVLRICQFGVILNLILGIFNLLPIPPLDGGRIATALMPVETARLYARLEPAGIFIVIVLLYLGGLNWMLRPTFQLVSFLLGVDFKLS